MSRIHVALAFTLLVAASQPAAKLTAVKPRASEAPVAASPTATHAPVAANVPKLAPPAGASSVLTGVITMDPSYIVASSAGSIISEHGAGVLAAGQGEVVASEGRLQVGGRVVAEGDGNVVAAAIISEHGAGVVAAGADQVEASAKGNIVAAGTGVLSNNGAGVVSNNGSGVVSNNGSGVVSTGGGQRWLLATAGTDPIPGAGMLVSVLSLRSHRYLSLGTYQGQPVYSVYTNANGAYKLYLPPEEAGNVLVVASAPGLPNDDRLIYNVVTDAKPHEAGIDEDVALMGRYLHFAFAARMADVLSTDDAGVGYVVDLMALESGISKDFLGTFKAFLFNLNHEARKYDVQHWKDPRDVAALATHVTDVGLSYLDPEERITRERLPIYKGPEEKAFQGLVEALKTLRQATAAKLAAEPGYFDGRQLSFDDRCGFSAPVAIEVKKSTDPGDFMVARYLTTNELNAFYNLDRLYDALGVPPFVPEVKLGQAFRVEAAGNVVLQALIPILLTHDDVTAEIQAFCTRPGFKPALDPSKTATPAPTCTPTR